MSTIENTKVTLNSRTKSGREYFNPYIKEVSSEKSVPLVVPNNKKLVSKKRLTVMSGAITVLLAISVVCVIQMFWMMKSSEDFYKKNMLLKNTAVAQQSMELVEIEGDTLTFKNEKSTFVTKVAEETTVHLEKGQTYNVSYNNGGLIYIGSIAE